LKSEKKIKFREYSWMARIQIRRLGFDAMSGLRLFFPLSFPEPYAWSPTVLFDEFNVGRF
jgi:hypothetical protein